MVNLINLTEFLHIKHLHFILWQVLTNLLEEYQKSFYLLIYFTFGLQKDLKM